MQHQKDVDYMIHIEGIPDAVSRQEDYWKVVKDVVRNIIDGQPKKVDPFFNSKGRLVFLCTFQSKDDAMKAYETLRGQSWYSFVRGGGHQPVSVMTVTCSEHRLREPKGSLEIAGPSDVPGSRGSFRPLIRSDLDKGLPVPETHRRASSTMSGMQSPLAPVTVGYGVRPPVFHSTNQPQRSMSIANSATVNGSFGGQTNTWLPPAIGQPYLPGFTNNSISRPGPSPHYPVPTISASSTSRQTPTASSLEHQKIIITNLQCKVPESTLIEKLNQSVGQVQTCKIERREDRKCHAFVTFVQPGHAEKAVRKLDKQELFERVVNVRLTKENGLARADGKRPVIVDGSITE